VTLHVSYNHQCPACEAYYIPFDKDEACPRCGKLESERFDFIRQASESARFNLHTYEAFLPPAWFVGSLGDHILSLLFRLLESYRKKGRKSDFVKFAEARFSEMNWGDQAYLKGHVLRAAVRVREELAKNP